MQNRLCKACSSIFARVEQPPDEELFPHHATASSCWAAVDDGCFMCTVLSKEVAISAQRYRVGAKHAHAELKYSFTADLGEANIGHFESTIYFLQFPSKDVLVQPDQSNSKPLFVSKVRFWLSPSDCEKSRHSSKSCELILVDPNTTCSIPLRGESTSSPGAIQMSKSWAQSCMQDHAACAFPATSPDFYPSRLVDLNPDASDKNLICVIETSETRVDQPYMTLSHRWGTHKFAMFTELNRPRMMEGFSMMSLPQTFQDAIHVTQMFGIRYIWIDCLCILQGSAEDFEGEAGLMHLVYGNSYCNLCATGARDNFEPLFRDRGASVAAYVEVNLARQKSPGKRYVLSNAQLWKHAVFARPVSRRAWVMQERFLAPRILHFGTDQVLRECRQLYASEQYPRGLPLAITYGAYDLKPI